MDKFRDYENGTVVEDNEAYENVEYEKFVKQELEKRGIDYNPDDIRRLAIAYYEELDELGYQIEEFEIDQEDKEKAFEKAVDEIIVKGEEADRAIVEKDLSDEIALEFGVEIDEPNMEPIVKNIIYDYLEELKNLGFDKDDYRVDDEVKHGALRDAYERHREEIARTK